MNRGSVRAVGSWLTRSGPWATACRALLASALCVSCAAETLFTISSNGPVAQRINIVVLSEGYTQAQLPQFRIDATNLINNFLSAQPYDEYRQYFNAFGIEAASAESGSDHPSRGEYRNTRFNSSYDTYGIPQFVTIPPNGFDADPAHGQGMVDALVQTLMPQAGLTLLLVNDIEYGGAGGSLLVSTKHPAGHYVVTHESGHTLAHLGDEYGDPFPGYPDTEEPNTTRETRREFIKWKSWLASSTPVPTPAEMDYADVIGLFEGAHYQESGWYRPKLDCGMRTLTTPFCEVCTEALVKSLYQRVRPINGLAPVSTNLQVGFSQTAQFKVTPQTPANHTLSIKWFTNGTATARSTSANLSLSAKSLGVGTHSVRVQVQDTTAMVRDDPDHLLTDTAEWSLTVLADPQLTLKVARSSPSSRHVLFSVNGVAPQGFALLASTNLSRWTSIGTNYLSNGVFQFTDNNEGTNPIRFYRCVTPP